jgi:sortase A
MVETFRISRIGDMSYPSRKFIRKRSKLMRVTGVTGEVLITAGALMGLFLAWHLVLNDTIQGDRQNQSAIGLAQQWQAPLPSTEDIQPSAVAVQQSDQEPPITASPEEGKAFALLYVPRFGSDYVRTIAEGVDVETVLNSRILGVGRYIESDPLGSYGNFALAAHRTTFGAPFGDIGELRIGDQIYVEVPDGWHAYSFRNLEYVWETEVDVLNSFPKLRDEVPGSRIITLTSCHPKFTISERVIAYGVYSGWYPRAGGAPSELADIVKGGS